MWFLLSYPETSAEKWPAILKCLHVHILMNAWLQAEELWRRWLWNCWSRVLMKFWVLRIWDKNTIDECPAKIAKLEEDKIKKATLCKRCEDPILILTLSVRKLSYRYQDLIKLISLLLMPWLLVSPGHQQTWCWLFEIGKSLSYTRKDSNYLCHISVKEW